MLSKIGVSITHQTDFVLAPSNLQSLMQCLTSPMGDPRKRNWTILESQLNSIRVGDVILSLRIICKAGLRVYLITLRTLHTFHSWTLCVPVTLAQLNFIMKSRVAILPSLLET